MLKPSVERLGERDDIKVLSVDTDENPGVAAKFDIYSIPTLLLFKDGVSVRKNVGFIPEPALKNFAEVE
jgi:thioredoxin 1